ALIFVILAPIAAQFVKLAVSRNREYLADATAVEITRNPVVLFRAIKKISGVPKDVKDAKEATAYLYIVRRFGGKRRNSRRKSSSLWAIHPSTDDRIKRLESM